MPFSPAQPSKPSSPHHSRSLDHRVQRSAQEYAGREDLDPSQPPEAEIMHLRLGPIESGMCREKVYLYFFE